MKWVIGDVTVTKIVELEMAGGSRFLLPQATREAQLVQRLPPTMCTKANPAGSMEILTE